MSRFFIGRPIFASVISIIIVIAGLVASFTLPVAQYPEIAPPTVVVSATYPGASAETLAKTVAAPIEEQLSGAEGLMYFSSASTANNTVTVTLTFEVDTDPDAAVVDVNNRVSTALPRLPEEVRRNGVTVQKRSANILLVAVLNSTDGQFDTLYLADYAQLNVLDELKRVPGVGDAQLFDSGYAMRVWVQPDRMAQLGITTGDVASALRAQNAQNAAGRIGAAPNPESQQLTFTVTAKGRLLEPEEFEQIVIRADGPKGVVRLGDIARIELGAESYVRKATVNGEPIVAMAVFLQTGANALDTAAAVKARLDALQKSFPPGVVYLVPYDTTKFIDASITEVVMTLAEAALLVVLVVFVFLQNWRATLIPIIAVPVSLIGTFAGLYAFGFSINTLTLFAMVLSIGIVVDDAIIVLENVERHMRVDKLGPRAAAIQAMREVSTAVVAIVLTLCAVFVPVAFLGGITGLLYQQFAVTVAISVVISGLVALTLTPALCALLLQPHRESKLFHPFNVAFDAITRGYLGIVRFNLRHGVFGLLVFIGVIAAAYGMLRVVPGSFVPEEDQGVLIGMLMLPDGATMDRTGATGDQFQQAVSKDPSVANVFLVRGLDFITGNNRSSAGTTFITFIPWDERTTFAGDLAKKFTGIGMSLPDGMALVFNPPAIRGVGNAGGFEAYVQNRADGDPKRLAEVLEAFTAELKKRPELAMVNSFFRANSPQLFVEVDEAKALAQGIALTSIYETLQSTMGALYVNDFNRAGRTYRVQMQADAPYRMRPEDVTKPYVRNAAGDMVPLASVVSVKTVYGAEFVERYNGFVAAKVLGSGVPGMSSGEVIRIIEEVAAESLPDGFVLDWTGQAFQEKRTGNTAVFAFGFAIVMVFLILAAQYERWSLPIAVVMAVPFALTGALLGVYLRGMPNDVYFQIGLIVLIGLAAKNAILIVEFASQKQAEGMNAFDAAVEAARLRFRPIIMTSLAFILGVLPLALSSGAGAAARRSMGTGVVFGMLAATFIATLFIPLFFKWLSRGKAARREDARAEGNPADLPSKHEA
ncbi:MAG: efflux RND transporter permease subunit [Thiotrichales bacterium]